MDTVQKISLLNDILFNKEKKQYIEELNNMDIKQLNEELKKLKTSDKEENLTE